MLLLFRKSVSHIYLSISLLSLVVIAIGLPLLLSVPGQQQIVNSHAATTVPRYEKFEVSFPYSGSYSNPYDPAVVAVDATFTSPSGKQISVPGFYFQDFTRSGNVNQETLTPVANSQVWKVRFAPSEIGNYSYSVSLKDNTGTKTLGNGTFSVISSNNHGFVRAQGLHFVFDDGSRYIPIGANAPWFQANAGGNKQWGVGTYGFDNMLAQYVANGGNTFAMWTCNSFAHPSINCNSAKIATLTSMSQPDSWQFDYMVQQAQAHNVYIIPVMKNVDQQNVDAGDPISIRYYIARWGYATAIASWSTFKEGAYNATVVHQYHQILSNDDPYHHLITASQGNHADERNPAAFNAVASDPLETLIQPHDYTNNCNVPYENDAALYFVWHAKKINFAQFNKPYWIGETGVHLCAADGVSDQDLTSDTTSYGKDTQGRILRSETWGEFMASAGALAPWNYFLTANVVAFKGISVFINALPPGPIPDSVAMFTNYNDTTQATASDPRLEVIGRKSSSFAILRVQNTTGTWAAILRDNQTPTPITGSVTLNGMTEPSYSVKWFDTVSGSIISSSNVTSNASKLTLALPKAITEDIAAMVTSGSSVTPPISPTPTPTGTATGTQFFVSVFLHGIGLAGDNANPNSTGNMQPMHPQRPLTVTVFDTNNTQVAMQQGMMKYDGGHFIGTIDMGNLASGSYIVKIKSDGYLTSSVPGIQSITSGQSISLQPVHLVTGDINNDNQLDILDYNTLLSCFGSKQNTSTCTAPPTQQSSGSDLDDDGIVGGADYNLFLRELSVQKGG